MQRVFATGADMIVRTKPVGAPFPDITDGIEKPKAIWLIALRRLWLWLPSFARCIWKLPLPNVAGQGLVHLKRVTPGIAFLR